MNKIYYLGSFLVLLLFLANNARATVHTIVSNSTPIESFNPNVVNAECGDTILWVNGNGIHTTASTTIPVGAQAWSSPDLNSTGYMYIVLVPGTYSYTCHPLTGGGHMDATIIVTCASVGEEEAQFSNFSVYPNPSSTGLFHLTGVPTEAQISIFDYLGREVVGQEKNYLLIDLSILGSGIYIVKISYQDQQITKRILIN